MRDCLHFIFSHKTYFGCFLSSLILALILTPSVARLARRLDAVAHPDHRRIHLSPTPLMGGLAIYFALWIPILVLYFWENRVTESLSERWWEILMIAMIGGAVMISGMIDDLRRLNATKKLLVQVPLAYLFVHYIGYFNNLTVPGFGSYELGDWGIPLTMLWIVGITNALNLVDGIDGLATGVSIVITFTNSIIAMITGNEFLAIVMLCMTGACLGFLYYNFAPAKIFLGDTGSLFLGITLATTAVLTVSKSQIAASFLVAVIVLGYPAMDTLLAMARRKIYGKPIFSADLGHIHHRLLAKGLNHPKASLVAYAFCGAFCLLALAMILQNSLATFLSVVLVSMMVMGGLYFLGFFQLFNPQEVKKTKTHYIISHHLGELLDAKLSIADSLKKIFKLFEQAGTEFGFSSIEIGMDSLLPQRGENPGHFRVNLMEGQGDNNSDAETGFFSSSDGLLKLRVEYLGNAYDEEVLQEYFLQLKRLLNRASIRIKELYPWIKDSERLMDFMGVRRSRSLEDAINNLGLSDHICLVYDGYEDWTRAVIPFIQSGLRKNEKCLYVLDGEDEAELMGKLHLGGVNFEEAERAGKMMILKVDELSGKGMFFDQDRMLSLLVSEAEKALKQGYSSLRLTWQMGIFSEEELKKLPEYESRLNKEFFNNYPCVGICQYDRRLFKPDSIEFIREAINAHSKVLFQGYCYIRDGEKRSFL